MKNTQATHTPFALFLSTTCLMLLFATTLPVHGQDQKAPLPEPEAASGAVLSEEELQNMREEEMRMTELYGFVLRVIGRQKEEEAYQKQQQQHALKKLQHLSDCRDEVRRANRDTKLSTMLRCQRAQLTLTLESLRKERAFVEERNGVIEDVRMKTVQAIDDLIGAISAIIDGIDTGVYTSEEDLLEAKTNLLRRYHVPKWRAMTRMRADRLLTWVAHLLQKNAEYLQNPELPEEETDRLTGMRTCLQEGALLLKDVRTAAGIGETAELFHQSLTHLFFCKEALASTMKSSAPEEDSLSETGIVSPAENSQEKVDSAEETSSPIYLPRPLRRQLENPRAPHLQGVLY